MKKLLISIPILLFFIFSCKDDGEPNPSDAPFNPFDTVTYTVPTLPEAAIDSNSFLGLHHYIFSKSCDQPGCHDGSFEPDFRTVESAYNTLVYHPIVKNYDQQMDGRAPLPYRVTPYEPEQSMLYKRITEHFVPNFERMPSSGIELGEEKINMIKTWIEEGAKNINGHLPSLTSTQPACYGLLAYLPNNNDQRIDTFRIDNFNFNPFVAPPNEDLELWFLLIDIDSDFQYVLGNELTYNKIQISKDLSDFSNAVELDLNVSSTPKIVNSVFSTPSGDQFPHYQNLTINPTQLGFESGDYMYLRLFVQDEDHDEATCIPDPTALIYVKLYFTIYLQ